MVRKVVHECLSTQSVYFEIAKEGVVPKALRQDHANFKKSADSVVSGMRPSGGRAHVTVLAGLLSAGHLCGCLTLDFTQRVFAQMKEIM